MGKYLYPLCLEQAVCHMTGGLFMYLGSLSIVGVGFVKIPPQFYEKGSFYV